MSWTVIAVGCSLYYFEIQILSSRLCFLSEPTGCDGGGVYCSVEIWSWGILAGRILTGGILSTGELILGGYGPGEYCRGCCPRTISSSYSWIYKYIFISNTTLQKQILLTLLNAHQILSPNVTQRFDNENAEYIEEHCKMYVYVYKVVSLCRICNF